MFRRIPVCLMVAALATSVPLLAVQTTSGRKTTTPAAGKAAPAATTAGAAAPVTPADVAPLMGTWILPLETPTGRLVANVVFRTEAGKVVAAVSAPEIPEHKTSDVTKRGQVVTIRLTADYSGSLSAYSGPVTMVMRLTPKGQDYSAFLDFNNAAYQISGTATKKK
jgi:hypothetical protein